jgi:hypothetical protein
MVIRPEIHKLTGELGAVVGKQELRRPALAHQTVQHLHYVFSA